MFLDYVPGNSLLHRLDIRTKCLGFLAISVLAFIFTNPLHNFALALLTIIIAKQIDMPFATIKRLLKPLIPIFILMFLVTGISYPVIKFSIPMAQHNLFSIFPGDRIIVTSGGLLYGLTFIFRIFVMVVSSTILTYTTSIDDFLELLQKMRLPYEVAFIVATGIRFIPTMEKKAQQVIIAQKARGNDALSGGVIRRVKSYIPVMIPLIVDSIRMSEHLAIAMQNRCFGAFKKRTSLNEIKMSVMDYLFSFLLIVVLIMAIYLRFNNWGRL